MRGKLGKPAGLGPTRHSIYSRKNFKAAFYQSVYLFACLLISHLGAHFFRFPAVDGCNLASLSACQFALERALPEDSHSSCPHWFDDSRHFGSEFGGNLGPFCLGIDNH